MTRIRRPGPVDGPAPQARPLRDSHGVQIRPTDIVMVTSWGEGARLIDTDLVRPVIRLNRVRVVILDAGGDERAIHPANLSVMRRDGVRGFEGNRGSMTGMQNEIRKVLRDAGQVESRDVTVSGFRLWISKAPGVVYLEARLDPDRFVYMSSIRWGNELISRCEEALTEQGFQVVRQKRAGVNRLKVERKPS